MTNAEARFNKSLRPRKPEGSLGRTAQEVHLDSHTAPELSMLLLLTSRAYLWTTSSVLLTRVAHQESKLLIWLRLSARLVNRDKDVIATTDAHHRPVRVHAQRPGKGLQAKQCESLRAQDLAVQKPNQTEITCLTVYTITPMH